MRSTMPAGSAGEVATQLVVEAQLTAVPAPEPKLTVLEPATKPVPVIVTTVPPTSGPALGETAVTDGVAS
ncbi:MAG: hypothetical protein ABSE47_01645 [Acidimicrobiales bacterium]